MLKGWTKFKKFLVVIMIVGIALLATACGADINYYTYSDKYYNYITLQILLDNVYKVALENSAAYDTSGNKWTLENYLKEVIKFMPSYTYDETVADDNSTYYSVVTKTRKKSSNQPQPTIKTNPFFHTMTVVEQNPFNGYRLDYDNASGYQSTTLMQRIKNGIGEIGVDGVYKQYVPSILEVFPILKSLSPDDLKLNYYWSPGTTRMRTSAIGLVEIDDKTYYCFSRNFDKEEALVEYQYLRANSIGWNVTAIVAGVLVVVIIYLVTRKKKDKRPGLMERFPYDPEEQANIYGNLPIKK